MKRLSVAFVLLAAFVACLLGGCSMTGSKKETAEGASKKFAHSRGRTDSSFYLLAVDDSASRKFLQDIPESERAVQLSREEAIGFFVEAADYLGTGSTWIELGTFNWEYRTRMSGKLPESDPQERQAGMKVHGALSSSYLNPNAKRKEAKYTRFTPILSRWTEVLKSEGGDHPAVAGIATDGQIERVEFAALQQKCKELLALPNCPLSVAIGPVNDDGIGRSRVEEAFRPLIEAGKAVIFTRSDRADAMAQFRAAVEQLQEEN